MLIRSTWILTVTEPMVLPRTYGLELVKELHRRMGLEMGEAKIPATTYSGILGRCIASNDFITFQPDEFYKLSICGLNEAAAKAIASLDLSSGLEFLGTKFEVCDRQDEITSYEELYTTLVANEPEPIHRFNLQFITPTAFAQGHNHLPLPLPSLMFRSWLERWNEFAAVYLGGDELIAYLEGAVVIKSHQIKTRSFQLPRGYINGFVGNVNLQISYRIDALLVNVANLLIQYSQYSGTGIKTRLGMGQTSLNIELKEL
ncbi:CRISPR system precrRNA processing endoribonuclease RAMP protein Cas6 [Planktothrix agardhii]|uniref:CRISPR system precrRNA processing endoribonuclease RAMP protein Cas6 n=1 Tax=Planktothrix agardhii TaxID=1160 RepID=UPI001D0B408F|nr:CRISPR system precrRNA processing endoribonuclease RAMP protein Cas6 [Planktothrix agardhii]MCB8762214.1 CRISPR system precrRNA processing endoribonuclease RAMP protein Cas6 [Planktothrix agardhii 1813]